ncbi:hypothetical protein BU16DRAFT_564574 [Lophium mytilinum]|uniref:Xylanolytic transcriptional activator regulatory domain-containing protein n=1 Tax=Lophium mytilinum TaxID=390894 RepID=A0A6A6QJG9_9PEZI|nr:hypothetical protein BU16DRAFT_564574 [Lophium mytilinum]
MSASSTTPSDQAHATHSLYSIPQANASTEAPMIDAPWFDRNALKSQPNPAFWSLDRVIIDHQTVMDLFQQFNDFYFPHLPIFEPVTSLEELYTSAPALFWGIVLSASLHHPEHWKVHDQLRDAYQSLLEKISSRPIQIFAELQALILICYWPLEIVSQSEDPSWGHSGLVINTALHMGLDKFQDEVLFGHRKAKFTLRFVRPRNRMMTWMKCFQISCQLSAWLGLPPPISSASSLHKLTLLYDDSTIPLEMIAMTEIQRQYARIATIFEETNNEPSLTLVQMFIHDLDDVKRRFSSAWTIPCEINLLGVKLYLLAIPLVSIDQQRLSSLQGSDAAAFLHTILQGGHSAALRLTSLMAEIGGPQSLPQEPRCAPYEQGGCPILAHPKAHFRLAYYACVVLLKYLDCNHSASPGDKEAARNAVSSTYQLFNNLRTSPQHVRAAASLEVLARTIVPNKERMATNVKSRMGASLMYNAIWTAANIRGFHLDPKYSVDASPVAQHNSLTPISSTNVADLSRTASSDARPSGPSVPEPMLPAMNDTFPWGVWDNGLFDALGFSWEDQPYAEIAGNMDFF